MNELAQSSMLAAGKEGMGRLNDDLWVISFIGRDRPGLISGILEEPARQNVNIVDMDQKVMQGIFVMTVVADFSGASITPAELESWLAAKTGELGMQFGFLPAGQLRGRRRSKKSLYVVTILAKDRVGIIRDVTGLAARSSINIERASVTARGELISIEFLMDFADCDEDYDGCKSRLKKECELLGLDVVIQDMDRARKEKRLIVFDMDMTIVDCEIINKLAGFAGVDEQVRAITERAMNGEMDFKESLRQRVRLLRGMPESTLQEIASNLVLTPGSEELLHHLKSMGYKIALISGGFTYFTDVLKERLGFDYAFANELEIKDGVVTGEIKGDIIDAEAKGGIIFRLAEMENISPDSIVAVGDGANDCLMIKNAGLGVAFNARDVLKRVSDGSLSRENLLGLLNVLGLAGKERNEDLENRCGRDQTL
ncbi:MAG TPA: phosphoserine phosphatase SerB [Methanothrix sp.]|jgi:phosphoserine phosphatase|nr:phosphoserine phosphatase SerB [Methanothrix sp.]HQE87395.1 phosphoserine phosphatase SerB [Methanothrix sp.]HQI67947.1 phosphoserine phosphatase SerB [Methanothrix sp.]HRT17027.1 phosphoserine phosphatase SerB [Methanothrix sp.]